jgi:transposase InsO family protein
MNARREAVLVENVRPLALAHRCPAYCFVRTVVESHICQSDQGLLAWYRIVVSKGRKDDGYDNALMERFNRTLTTEYMEHASYQTHAQARWLIFEYLEAFYRRQRLHSSPGYVSPLSSEL